MSKTCKSLVLAIIVAMFVATPVSAQTTLQLQIDSPYMVVDDEPLLICESGAAPVIINGRTVVPLRPVIEAMGGTVGWDGELRLITIRDSLSENEIILKINSYDSVINAQTGPTLDVTPILINDITKVPIMFVSYHLGFDIEWDQDTRTITLSKD